MPSLFYLYLTLVKRQTKMFILHILYNKNLKKSSTIPTVHRTRLNPIPAYFIKRSYSYEIKLTVLHIHSYYIISGGSPSTLFFTNSYPRALPFSPPTTLCTCSCSATVKHIKFSTLLLVLFQSK